MEIQVSTDFTPKELFRFFSRSLPGQLYVCGGLDNKFSTDTSWYVLHDSSGILSAALIHKAESIPTLIALGNENKELIASLLDKIKHELPDNFYSYTALSVADSIQGYNIAKDYGKYYQMYMDKNPSGYEDPNMRMLASKDLDDAISLYRIAYPDNFFTESLLNEGIYLGYYVENELVGIAGTNITSKKYGISSIGNIAVHPNWRCKGIATKLTSSLCNILLPEMPNIGLSVHTKNLIPLAFYKKLGFSVVDEYEYKLLKRN